MKGAYDFDATIAIKLRRDEAIVLQGYLVRELWRSDPGGLQSSITHPAEAHSLEGLLQELIQPLIDTGGPDSDAIHAAAVEHLMARFQ